MAREMKDSGIEWYGSIPKDWIISRVGLHYDIILGKMLCSEPPSADYTLENYYCAANVHFDGISSAEALKQMWFSSLEKKLYRVQRGDMLVVEGGAGAGGSAVVPDDTQDTYIQNSIMIVRNRNFQENRYLRYLVEYLVKSGYVDVVCNKATIPHFTKEKVSSIPYPVVSLSDMVRIVDYLDYKCAEIDETVTRTQEAIEECKALKQAVITEAITKGVRGDRPMKDSGVEWIGRIPIDWNILKFGAIATLRNGYVGPTRDLFQDAGVCYIQSLHIKDGKIDFGKQEYYVSEDWAKQHPKIHTNDLLIVQTGDIGQVG